MGVRFVLEPDLWKFWEGGQHDFVYDFKHRYIAIEAGWMCVRGDTVIDGSGKTIEELASNTNDDVIPVNTMFGRQLAFKPFPKMKAKLITFGLSNGKEITVAEGHRFWSSGSWLSAAELNVGQPLLCSVEGEMVAEDVLIADKAYSGFDWVFDLHVPFYNHYFANGILSHNSGKTYAGARKLLTLHMLNSVDARGKPTYVPSLVVAPSIGALEDFMIPELEKACSEINLDFEYQPGKRRIALADLGHRGGMISHIKMRTAERPDLITGFEVGAIWGDEAARWKCDLHNPKNDPFIQCIGRLRHPKANILQALFTYTNEGDTTRVYKWIREKNEQNDRAVYQARTLDNPVAKDFYEAMSGALTDDLKVQYLEGGTITLSGGNVYRSFDVNVNVDNNVEYNFYLPLQIAIDFNISPGMHLIIGQYDRDQDLFTAIDECFIRRGSVREIIEAFGKKVSDIINAIPDSARNSPNRFLFPALEVFGDATGKSEWAGTGESCYMILGDGLTLLQKRLNVDFGVRAKIPKANPYIEERINAVNVAFKDLNGQCHYKIHPRCERLITDYKELKRNSKGDVDKNSNPELSHASDAEGYRIHYQRPVRKLGNRPGSRVSVNASVSNNPIAAI